MKRIFFGPAAIFSVLLAIGFFILAGLAAFWSISGTASLIAPAAVFAIVGFIVLVLGARTAVKLGDTGIEVLGDPMIPYSDIDGVRLERRGKTWWQGARALPIIEVAEGRAVRDIPLDGLLAASGSRRLRAQAERIAELAHVKLDDTGIIYDVKVAPRRGL
ncbi:MAG: hypothetical protein ACRDAX_09235 [Propionibacteriaceae bacterium]